MTHALVVKRVLICVELRKKLNTIVQVNIVHKNTLLTLNYECL